MSRIISKIRYLTRDNMKNFRIKQSGARFFLSQWMENSQLLIMTLLKILVSFYYSTIS